MKPPRLLKTTLIPLVLFALVSCREGRVIGPSIEAEDGASYYWLNGDETAERMLVRHAPGAARHEVLAEGVFANIIGPVLTDGGVAWAVEDEAGAWSLHQTGVGAGVQRRSQGVTDAVAAAWALERVGAGHAPGDAADLARLGEFARGGEWPRE